MTRSFGLDASSALEALKTTVEKFEDDDLNEDLARDCAIKAWHLCDHVFIALGSNSQFPNLKDLKYHVIRNCPELSYLKDICNESKHAEITKYEARIKKAHLHRGGFKSKAFSRGFNISRLEVMLSDGQPILFNDVVDRAVEFWSKFFGDNGIK